MPNTATVAKEKHPVANNILPEDIAKKGRSFKLIFWIVLLLLVLVCFARVPYCGNYVDSYILDFTVGHAKYWIYLFVCTFLIMKIFNSKKVKRILSKRFILSYSLLILATIFAFAISNYIILLMRQESSLNFISEFNKYIGDFNNYASHNNYNEFINLTASGGIIGCFLVAIWQYIAIALVCLIALGLLTIGICGFMGRKSIFAKKIRYLCIRLLGGNVNNSLNYDELAVEKNDIKPKVYRAIDIKNEANKPNQLTPPITFLTDTSIDNYFDNKRKGEKNQIIIEKTLKENDIHVTHNKTSVMPLYTNISFELARSTDAEHVLTLQNHILRALNIETFIITVKGNIVNFEIPNDKPSKVSIKSVLMTLDKINGSIATVGLNTEGAPLTLDLKQNPNILIIGRRGSGASMLLSSLIISLAYTNIPDDLEFVILSHIGDKSLKHFNNLQHLKVPLVTELEDVVKELHIFNAEVTRRQKLIHSHKTTSIMSLNSKLNNDIDKIKTLVLVITGFDKLIKVNPECERLLVNILANSDKLNIKVILLSTNANEQTLSKEINEHMSVRFVLKLESEAESNNIFGNNRGLQLYSNGDGFMFNTKNDKRMRFQACYLNMNELIQIVNTINSFFQFKNESL